MLDGTGCIDSIAQIVARPVSNELYKVSIRVFCWYALVQQSADHAHQIDIAPLGLATKQDRVAGCAFGRRRN